MKKHVLDLGALLWTRRARMFLVALSSAIGLVCVSLLLFGLSQVQADPGAITLETVTPPTSEPGLHLLRSDETGIVLELYTPDFRVEQRMLEDFPCDLLSVSDYATTDEVGWPQLPVHGAMLGVPPQAELGLNVVESESVAVPGRYDLCPAPRLVVEQDVSGEIRYGGLEFARDERAYATNAFYPTPIAEIASTGFIRNQRFVQLWLHPFQYNPVTGELRHYKLIQVELSFSYEERRPAVAAGGVREAKSFEQILESTILNYDSAKKWRERPRPIVPQATALDQTPNYKILVDEDGIYQVTNADLQTAAGDEVDSLDPRTFQLHNQGEEVAIYVTGEGDNSFDPADYILFYGQKMNTKYTDVNVYWLTWGGADGRRMAEVNGSVSGSAPVPPHFQTTRRMEEDHAYGSGYPSGPDKDRWYWNDIYAAGSPASSSYTTKLQHIATAPLSATVRGLLKGYAANPQHHTRVYLNGHLIDDATWDPQAEYAFDETVPQSYLMEGTNAISVECPLDGGITLDALLVNWFEIDYHDTYTTEEDSLFFDGDEAGTWQYEVGGFSQNSIEAFDITDPANVSRIINAVIEQASSTYTLKFEDTIAAERKYIALTWARRKSPLGIVEDSPSDLKAISNGADYIIITHADFYADVLALANHRTAQGPRTVVVDVQDVYDEFSYGVFDPTAIRDFLTYAYANWTPPAPAYVLLVGDGNFDFKDNYGWGEPNYVPPYLADVDPSVGETAADNRYGCVSGDDILPDMYIGRLPVKTSADASTMVNKILNYEQNSLNGDWNKDVLFAADNADSAGDFAALSDDIADNYLPSSYTAQKVYYKVTHSTANEVRTAIVNAINEGRLMINYIGHSGVQYWAAEKLFSISDIAALSNIERLPLMMPMTCLDGYFIWPKPPGGDYSSLGESIVRAPGGGAIASWSPTGLGMAMGHHYLNQGFFTAVFTDEVREIGPATTLGKLYLYNNTPGYRDLIDTYVLFGDPFMKLNLPACDAADFDNDGQITEADMMQVAAHWNTQWGDAGYDRKYDLDDNGRIDVLDIMRVAAHWDEVC